MSMKVTPEEVTTNLDTLCSQVVETGEAIIITRPDGKNAALISETELNSLLETLYILRSPAFFKSVINSITTRESWNC